MSCIRFGNIYQIYQWHKGEFFFYTQDMGKKKA